MTRQGEEGGTGGTGGGGGGKIRAAGIDPPSPSAPKSSPKFNPNMLTFTNFYCNQICKENENELSRKYAGHPTRRI